MSRATLKQHLRNVEQASVRRGLLQPPYKLSAGQIEQAARIVVEVNSRLNAPQVTGFSEILHTELDAVIDRHVQPAMKALGIDEPKMAALVRNSVTCALYLKLEDLLATLHRNKIKLK